MTIGLILLGSICVLIGIIGCVLPALPGPILVYIGLLLLQATGDATFSTEFLIIRGGINIIVFVLDYIIPILGTKAFGGSKRGNRGSILGLILGAIVLPLAGLVSGPFALLALIVGPFVGAYIGERLRPHTRENAWRAARGSFLGFLGGMFLKLVVSLIMAYFFVQGVYNIIM